MSYANGLILLLACEGGYASSNPPEGPTFAGILQTTWFNYLHQRGIPYHWPPTREEVGTFYIAEYWAPLHLDEMPEPADAIALQMMINLPTIEGNRTLQCALQVDPDGLLGDKTRHAFMMTHPMDLAERILIAQASHYCARPASPHFRGLINRVQVARNYLRNGAV